MIRSEIIEKLQRREWNWLGLSTFHELVQFLTRPRFLGGVRIENLPVYPDTMTALTNGLTAGDLYRLGSNPDVVMIVSDGDNPPTFGATTAHIPDSSDRRYVTDAERVMLQNLTGIPTSPTGLPPGRIWCDTSAGNVLKVT